MADVLQYSNAGLILGKQSGRGVPATTLAGCYHYQNITHQSTKNVVASGAAMGKGHANRKNINTNYRVNMTASGLLTAGKVVSDLFTPQGSKAAVATVATSVKRHVYTPGQVVSQVPLLTAGIYFNSYAATTTYSTPDAKIYGRDMVQTALRYGYALNQFPNWSYTLQGVNEGPGEGDEAVTFENSQVYLAPSGPTGISLPVKPSWFPTFSSLCLQSSDTVFGYDVTEGECANDGSVPVYSVVTGATTTMVFAFNTTDALDIYEWVKYLTATPADGFDAIQTGIMEGALSIKLTGQDTIASSDPATKYSLTAAYSAGTQWPVANIQLDQKRNLLTVEAVTTDTNFTHTLDTALNDTYMEL